MGTSCRRSPYPQPLGLTWDELVELLRPLLASPGLTGVSLADLEPDRDPGGTYARRVVEAIEDAWPRKVPRPGF